MLSLVAIVAFFTLANIARAAFSGKTSLPIEAPASQKRGAVSSLDARCSMIGTGVLQKGGNTADATVATQFCLGVVGMHLTGIGGGGFALVRAPNGTYEFVDFRESAPAASFENMYDKDVNASILGGLSSGVPGEVRGLSYIHARYGSLCWKDLIIPSIKLAREGFTLGVDVAYYMDTLGNDALFLKPAWAPDFAPHGKRLKAGEKMSRQRYARALQEIADKGAEAFYTGSIAKTMVASLRSSDGIMTLEDMKDYEVISRVPRSISYRGFSVTSGGAPSGGIVALKILKTLEGYKDAGTPSQFNITTHRLDEAIRFAYGARTKLGDPSFVNNMESYQDVMIAENTAEQTRQEVLDERTQPVKAYNPDGIESLETPGTSHVSVADASGMAISLTSTVNLLFGSQVMVNETGIIMNNEMNDFSIPNSTNAFGFIASPANYIQPRKRPLSSITPVIIEDTSTGALYVVIGAAGGSRIITSTVLGIWNILDRHMNVTEAIRTPRFHEQLIPNEMMFEHAFDNLTIDYLRIKGHHIGWLDHGSDLQIIRRLPNGTFEAASEIRQHDSGGFAV
ncbi:gamma-glutamyltranspeptidase [Lophiotrema nucula]|uniref:Glutathione hydrolase n=1 Tax=Lophiotrema nucula TaxID=690887 RepID=A0A6A5YEL7_9PLEO|nr:gamma-glutamyltranspeptidase [Lophiotrema nucula]